MRRGDRINDLPISERIAVPMEMTVQIPRGFGHTGPNDERAPRLIQSFQICPRQHGGIGGDHHRYPSQVMAPAVGVDDLNDRGGLSGTALKTADLQRKTSPVDQQANHDLWIDAALLRIADLAERVFVLGLEVQRLCRAFGYADVSDGCAGQRRNRCVKSRHIHRVPSQARMLGSGWYVPGLVFGGRVRSIAVCLMFMSACR